MHGVYGVGGKSDGDRRTWNYDKVERGGRQGWEPNVGAVGEQKNAVRRSVAYVVGDAEEWLSLLPATSAASIEEERDKARTVSSASNLGENAEACSLCDSRQGLAAIAGRTPEGSLPPQHYPSATPLPAASTTAAALPGVQTDHGSSNTLKSSSHSSSSTEMAPKGGELAVLMVAEKPSIAETLASILSNNNYTKRKGISPVTSVWEFRGNFAGEPVLFKVTSTAGHIYQTEFPPAFNDWQRVDPLELFDAPVVKTEAQPKHRLPRHLQEEAKGCAHLVLWLDCDREGENICFEVINIVKSCLVKNIGKQQIWRAHFSALAPADVQRALKSLGTPNKDESDAVDARQELDLKIGVAFTRFQTKHFQGKYGDLDSSLISYGPCQTPTLQLCVQRSDAIQAFKPEEYYQIKPLVRVGEQELSLEWARGQVFDRVVAQTFHAIVRYCGRVAVVTAAKQSEEVLAMPQALNTVSLLKAASQRLGIGPHHAMQIAERLYLGGYITYPRTETCCYPPSFDLQGAVQAQTTNAYWGMHAQQILARGIAKPRSGMDAGDHPPITPVRSVTENEIGGGDAWRMYELVARTFLATVSGNCKFKKQTLTLAINGESFTTSARVCIDPGFTAVLRESELRDTTLPNLKPGDELLVQGVSIVDRMTSPPSYLSESDLLSLLEKHRIGTDASMATHINNICERNYVSLTSGRRLEPTKLGICLIHGLMAIDAELVLPFVRASIEQLVDVIAKGKAPREAVVLHSLNIFKAKFAYFVNKIERMDALFGVTFTALSATGNPLSRCGRCGRYLNFIARRPFRLYCRTCDVTLDVPQTGAIKLYKELKCPLDGYELLLSVNPGGKAFPFCPLCYNDPPFDTPGTLMSCMDCRHPSCRHSINRAGVMRCPQENCDGLLYLNPVSAPRWRLDCTICRYELLLFEGAFKVAVTDDECAECGSMKLDVVFSKTSPLKDGSTERKGCVVCDPVLNEFVSSRLGNLARQRRGGFRGRGRRGFRGARKAPVDPKLSFDRF
ncbi:DNA topoisomerase 3-beta-1 [Cyclospora cayetanensis]|uniref:DNA topoisomerase n=1 Tax=Cyclospora cayetanensis TaxID=88456 RepID=A0A6P6RYA4_9EIME|nr:DNA topoisomerase 3-beta-1 [Cyclospora cayetanensis]